MARVWRQYYTHPSKDATLINPQTQRPYEANHPIPRACYIVQHAHTPAEAQIYAYLAFDDRCPRKQLSGGLGWLIENKGARVIGEALKMPRQTVKDNLRSLQRKHSIIPTLSDGKRVKRKPGDGLGSNNWRIPTFREVLQTRAADPNIYTAPGTTRCFVIGPGRRFITPDEAKLWQLRPELQQGIDGAVLGATPEELDAPAAIAQDVAPDKPTAASPPLEMPQPPPKVATELTYTALRDAIRGQKPSKEDAKRWFAEARKHAQKEHGLDLSDDDGAMIVRRAALGTKKPIGNVRYFYGPTLASNVDAYLQERIEYEARDASPYEAFVPPEDDGALVVSTDQCRQCGGTIETYSDGTQSLCACKSRKHA